MHQTPRPEELADSLLQATGADAVCVGLPDDAMSRLRDIAAAGLPAPVTTALATGLRGTSLNASPATIAATHGSTVILSLRDPVERHPGQHQLFKLTGLEHALIVPGPAHDDGWRLLTALGWKPPNQQLTPGRVSTIQDAVHNLAHSFDRTPYAHTLQL